MKTVIFFLLFIFSTCFSSTFAENSANIVVKVTNMRNKDGVISASLFKSEKGFPSEYEHALKTATVKIDADTVTLVFKDVEFGVYAIGVMHDENENNKFDTNFLGIPQEGFAVSNNVEAKRRAPRFSEGKFEFNAQTKPLVLRLIYF